MPRYGGGSLADLVPTLLAGLGVPGMTGTLVLDVPPRVCLLLIDGLGWELLRDHPGEAPFLRSLATEPITAGFPATTAVSLATLGTGVPVGEHGVVGLSFAVGGEVLNALRWNRHGVAEHVDLRSTIVPEEVQPRRTAFELAADAGVAVRVVAPREQRGSGLTRAVLRGGEFHGVHALGDLASAALDAVREGDRAFCYAYHGDLDLLGHVYGPGSEPWRRQLAHIDRLAADIAADLPRGGMLVVTADHGMVEVGEEDRVDLDTSPELRAGVALIGGETRVRHLYTEPGALADVREVWTSTLGERAWIASRDEAIEAGWFGPRVGDLARARIGDLVVAATGTLVVTRSTAEPLFSGLVGHHGSLTAAEQLIPMLVAANVDDRW